MNASRRVRTTIALAIGGLSRQYEQFRDHPDLQRVYPEYLVRSHMIVRASVPLLEAARDRARDLGGAVGEGLASYLEMHIAEERDHDEWALDDLEVLGLRREDVLARMPPPSVAAKRIVAIALVQMEATCGSSSGRVSRTWSSSRPWPGSRAAWRVQVLNASGGRLARTAMVWISSGGGGYPSRMAM